MPEEMDAFDRAFFELVKGEVLELMMSGMRDRILEDSTRTLTKGIVDNLKDDPEVIEAVKAFMLVWFDNARSDALREKEARDVRKAS